jgi:hypothetical protein
MMFQKTAKIFLFLSVFFFFGHSFTAHAHAENEEPFLLHEHQDARDFFSCLFSIDLGENHLSVYSGENPQVFDFSGFIPMFPAGCISCEQFKKFYSQNAILYSEKSRFYTVFFSKNVPSRAPPLV